MAGERTDPTQAKFALHQGTRHLCDTEFDRIRDFTCRPDDIWVCSFPRSGTTLTQQMVYLIQTLDFEKASTVLLTDRFPYIDINSTVGTLTRGCNLVEAMPTNEARLVKTHLHYFLLPKHLRTGTGRIIYIVRNPKSAAPSMFRLMNYCKQGITTSMREYLEDFLNGIGWACPWGLHVRQFWEHRDDENILFLQYEHTVKDRRGAIRRIAEFLNRDLTEADIDKIFDATSIDKMRDNKGVNLDEFEELFNINEGFGRFINSGEIDGWRKDIPEDLVCRFDEMIEKKIGHTDIKFT